jgi:hypothetical protein
MADVSTRAAPERAVADGASRVEEADGGPSSLFQLSTIPRLAAMSTQLSEPWTVERFLAWEDEQEGRHEFDGTRVIPMTGGSRRHQRLVSRLLRLLEDSLDLERFDVVQEMRL